MDLPSDGRTFVYLTYEELFGKRKTHAELVAAFAELSVDDCLATLGRISCLLEAGQPVTVETQSRILRALGLGEDVERPLLQALTAFGGFRPLFTPQLVAHAFRFSLQHAARTPPTVFEAGRLGGRFVDALLGLSDLLGSEIDPDDEESVYAFLLRQHGISQRNVRMYGFVRHWYLLTAGWADVHGTESAEQLDAQFRSLTGISIGTFYALGALVHAYFLNFGTGEGTSGGVLDPFAYYAATALLPSEIEAFFKVASIRAGDLALEVENENERYGPTEYRSASFDRTPLVRIGADHNYVPATFLALERFVTEAPYWLLRNSSLTETGRDEDFTSRFGLVFERFATNALSRIAAADLRRPLFTDEVEYRVGKSTLLSSDANLFYDQATVFVEIVSGRTRIATATRGDFGSFQVDVAKLVDKKARQLGLRYRDFALTGKLRFAAVPSAHRGQVWGVVVMLEDLPLSGGLYGLVQRNAMRRASWHPGQPTLSIWTSDELGAVESLVEQGVSVLDLLRRWKRSTPHHSLTTFLADGPPPGLSSWYRQQYASMTNEVVDYLE